MKAAPWLGSAVVVWLLPTARLIDRSQIVECDVKVSFFFAISDCSCAFMCGLYGTYGNTKV